MDILHYVITLPDAASPDANNLDAMDLVRDRLNDALTSEPETYRFHAHAAWTQFVGTQRIVHVHVEFEVPEGQSAVEYGGDLANPIGREFDRWHPLLTRAQIARPAVSGEVVTNQSVRIIIDQGESEPLRVYVPKDLSVEAAIVYVNGYLNGIKDTGYPVVATDWAPILRERWPLITQD